MHLMSSSCCSPPCRRSGGRGADPCLRQLHSLVADTSLEAGDVLAFESSGGGGGGGLTMAVEIFNRTSQVGPPALWLHHLQRFGLPIPSASEC